MAGNAAKASGFIRFFNFLANLGLAIRDDPPKVIDIAGREWGDVMNPLQLSIREIPREEPRQQVALSVVIRNAGSERKTLSVPGWLFFYEVQVVAPDGSAVPLSTYGGELLKPERRTEHMEIRLNPGDAKETDLPLGVLYNMRASGSYRARVQCRLPDGSVVASNEIVVAGPA